MFESLYSGQAEPGAKAEADLPVIGPAAAARATMDRYGDVPLGVESAWPAASASVAA